MAQGITPATLISEGFVSEVGSDGSTYWLKRQNFPTHVQFLDASEIKVWIAAQRYLYDSDHVKKFDCFRETRDSEIHHIDKFRFRMTTRQGKHIPFYGPDLMHVHYRTRNDRRDAIKTKNFRVLSLIYHGDFNKPLKCTRTECPNYLVGHTDLGIQIRGMDGDIHHIVVWENKSLAKSDKDPSKLLEACDLHDGMSLVSQEVLSELMQCAPFCDNCHGRRHKAMYIRSPETAHGDFSDYKGDEPFYLKNQRNYDFVNTELQKLGYPPMGSMEKAIERLTLPEYLKIRI